MGLFTNPNDRHLPTIIVLEQLQPKDVYDFLHRGFYQSLDRSNTTVVPMVRFAGMSPEQIQTAMEKHTATVLEVRNLADKILRQRTEIGKTHLILIDQFNTLYRKHSQNAISSLLTEFDQELFVSSITIHRSAENSISNVLLIVLDDLVKIIQNNIPVKICPECGFPFPIVPGKRSKFFCSDRCGTRERTRRYHKNKKNTSPEENHEISG